VVGAHDIHIRTFRSTIDGSVQQYAVRPASHDAASDHEHHSPALMLALHPAGVSCEEFVEQYAAKDWAHVVVPTGRRAYGFDWEDWGRTDALEALADAQRHYSHNPARIFLTGNSMGGHGVWHLGVTYPARFAAIGPVDAWASFWSYGGGIPIADDDAPIDQMLLRAYAPSDTLKLIGNLRDVGVSIVHHENNTDVSVAQSRFMRSRLAEFHSRFAYFETPGSSETTTVDSPALMEFLRLQPTHTDDERDTIDFTTASPGVSHGSHWVSIEAQLEQLRPSRVAIRRDKPGRAFVAKTINVARLAIDIAQLSPSQPIHVAIDGQTLPPIDWPNSDARLWFERTDDEWTVSDPPDATQKHPHRYGTFKSVFDNRVVLVYGTQGTAEENAWAAAKARFDAETFWYRGNGSLDVLADTEFRPEAEPDRNVVLYGNADTNSAWPALLSTSPVQVRGGQVRVGVRPEADDDLATLFVRPRPGSDRAVVGVVGGTGPVGMRLTNRLRYFVSGVAYSDVLVFGPGVLTEGTADIRAAGFFGNDWRVESGEFEWRDMAL
jgi:pimeloyl-ACP methyl ester carboxylesterase